MVTTPDKLVLPPFLRRSGFGFFGVCIVERGECKWFCFFPSVIR